MQKEIKLKKRDLDTVYISALHTVLIDKLGTEKALQIVRDAAKLFDQLKTEGGIE